MANTSPRAASSDLDPVWEARVELAACYRAVALYGMTDLIYNHISLRVPGRPHNMLINRFGLMYEEITASNLVEVDPNGGVVEGPAGALTNPAGYIIHSCIHEARADVGCVIHTHSRAGIAVSAMDCGLLPITQTAMMFHGAVAYHDFEGPALNEDEKSRLVADLGDKSVMILRNHGLLTVGGTCAEAFLALYHLENACKVQVDVVSASRGFEPCSEEVAAATAATARTPTAGGSGPFRGAGLEWRAVLRRLDRLDPSYRL